MQGEVYLGEGDIALSLCLYVPILYMLTTWVNSDPHLLLRWSSVARVLEAASIAGVYDVNQTDLDRDLTIKTYRACYFDSAFNLLGTHLGQPFCIVSVRWSFFLLVFIDAVMLAHLPTVQD